MKNIVLVFSLCILTATLFGANQDDGFFDMRLIQGARPIVEETLLAEGDHLVREQIKNQIRAKYLQKYAEILAISRVEVSIYTVLNPDGQTTSLRANFSAYNDQNKIVLSGSELAV